MFSLKIKLISIARYYKNIRETDGYFYGARNALECSNYRVVVYWGTILQYYFKFWCND